MAVICTVVPPTLAEEGRRNAEAGWQEERWGGGGLASLASTLPPIDEPLIAGVVQQGWLLP